jgi:hypothetical protein
MAQQKPATKIQFPAGGLVRRLGYQNQSPYTTPLCVNVWADDASVERERGGVRAGTEKAYTTDTGGLPNLIADVAYANSGSLAIKTVVANGGVLYYSNGTGLTAVSPSPALTLSTSFPLGYADLNQKLYILADNHADQRLCVYNPVDNTLVRVTLAAGSFPTKCRLLSNYNNRLIWAGDANNPQNIYSSRQDAPGDYDYGQEDSQAAVALNATDQGRIGEPITALIPHSKSCMIIGCTTSLWVINGDFGTNGTVERLSDNIGVVDGNAWCFDSEGYLYFLSPDGLYVMSPGCGDVPRSVSRERLPQELLNVNRTTHRVSMAYDVRYRGIFLSITATGSNSMDGWWIDTKQVAGGDSGGNAVSFWPTNFASNDHHPVAIYAVRDGVQSTDGPSSVLLGCRDGYIRRFNRTASNDDGTSIVAYLDMGPFPLAPPGFEGLLQEVQVTLGETSGKVNCQIRAGQSAEEAYGAKALAAQALNRGGLNPSSYPRLRGQSAMIRLSNVGLAGSRFFLEDVMVRRTVASRRRV